MSEPAFWQTKKLAELSGDEWESLCDGCGKCCLHKLECEDTFEVFYTDVACRYLDLNKCVCKDYALRLENVPACLNLEREKVAEFTWLPSTCAYRLLSEGKPLPDWHYLVSGDRESVHAAGQSVRGKVISENNISEDEFEDRVIYWVE